MSLIRALTYQTAKDSLDELAFPLGLSIDQFLGMIGAYQVQGIPKISFRFYLKFENWLDKYADPENVLYSRLLKSDSRSIFIRNLSNEEVEILMALEDSYKIYDTTLKLVEDLEFNEARGLDIWCAYLIVLNK